MSTTNSTAAAVPDPDRWNETRAPQALVVVTLCPAIALVVLMMRLYTRAFLLKRVFWEDYIVSVAMVFAIMMAVFMNIAFTNGSGRHIETLSRDQLILQSRISPGVHVPYILTHLLVKLSILLHYTRISVMAFERRLCYVLIGILTTGYIVVIVLSMVRCIPFEALWTPIPGAKCLNTTQLFLAIQSHTLAMDFIILLAPLCILRHLTIPWAQRVLLIVVVGFGGVACIASIVRLQVLRLSTTSPDRTWDSYYSAIYGAIETNLAIICACVVTLRPMFRRWRWFSGAGEAETSKVELEIQNVRRNVPDDILVDTIDGSTKVLSTSRDVEQGVGDSGAAERMDYESKRELVRVTSLTVDKDDSCAGSTVAGSGSSRGRQDSDGKGSSKK